MIKFRIETLEIVKYLLKNLINFKVTIKIWRKIDKKKWTFRISISSFVYKQKKLYFMKNSDFEKINFFF